MAKTVQIIAPQHAKVLAQYAELESRYDHLLTSLAAWQREAQDSALDVLSAQGYDYEEAVTRLVEVALRGGVHARKK